MKSDFLIALTQLAAERNLPREVVLSAIEAALGAAYRKDSISSGQNISVKLNPGSGEISVYVLKTVVDELTDPNQEILLEDARKLKPDAEIGDNIPTESIPHSAGRIAAQTAKQVVMQRLREAERELVFAEFSDKEGEVYTINIQRVEPRQLIVDLGRAEAILPASEQVPFERYRVGQKMKVVLQSVQRSSRGPELIVSRADKLLLKRLFEMEVPEVYNGAVEIVAIAREPGSRSKVAVRARQNGVDPVGSCVGLRGVRIQNIVNELQGEKIDVLEWSKDTNKFIANALSPSQVMRVELDPEEGTATAIVPDRQLSLAIGKEGQNARLAARLTGWKIDIKSNVEADAERTKKAVPEIPAAIEEAVADLTAEDLVEAVAEPVEIEIPPEVAEAIPEPVAASVQEVVVQEEPAEMPVAEVVTEVEAPVVEELPPVAPEPVVEEVAPEVEVPEKAPEPVVVEEVPVPVPEPQVFEPEPVPVLDHSSSLRDVPEDIWSIRNVRTPEPEPGRIRFAEDIVGLRGGVTARRGRKGGGDHRDRRRRSKAGRRRR